MAIEVQVISDTVISDKWLRVNFREVALRIV